MSSYKQTASESYEDIKQIDYLYGSTMDTYTVGIDSIKQHRLTKIEVFRVKDTPGYLINLFTHDKYTPVRTILTPQVVMTYNDLPKEDK